MLGQSTDGSARGRDDAGGLIKLIGHAFHRFAYPINLGDDSRTDSHQSTEDGPEKRYFAREAESAQQLWKLLRQCCDSGSSSRHLDEEVLHLEASICDGAG
ncbi:hypothetical protein [Gemmobacter sp. LW-1]|uniref:hypothetical protein n=1 Tax=Gemmobacter sp. LW-1 TaxID=1529005 RepID=UPI00128F6045|nr:hypothetical protein [Gemmobacter sp. LW-1]